MSVAEMFQEYKENCKIKNKIINFPKKKKQKKLWLSDLFIVLKKALMEKKLEKLYEKYELWRGWDYDPPQEKKLFQ